MNRIDNCSKAGFTLLEVVLSVAIMLILTTMMMNGFAATVSYSYHTSVFATTAGTNYKTAISQVGKNSQQGKSAYTTMGKGYTGVSDDDCKTIKIPQALAGYKAQDLNVQLYRENGGAAAAQSYGFKAEVESYGDTADGTYANNRTSFYYYPKLITVNNDETTRGKVIVYYMPAGDDYGGPHTEGYYWVDTVHNKIIEPASYAVSEEGEGDT
ncbi:prepilin-type N-terminal cleavage/methylation domain-containing protein [Ruminococcaceae bacterium YRB3002]|nr:prepilin-type N-terminal cleavage/methylation domain-containing protein [Ruminococcaceae bacterium YRB3002]